MQKQIVLVPLEIMWTRTCDRKEIVVHSKNSNSKSSKCSALISVHEPCGTFEISAHFHCACPASAANLLFLALDTFRCCCSQELLRILMCTSDRATCHQGCVWVFHTCRCGLFQVFPRCLSVVLVPTRIRPSPSFALQPSRGSERF